LIKASCTISSWRALPHIYSKGLGGIACLCAGSQTARLATEAAWLGGQLGIFFYLNSMNAFIVRRSNYILVDFLIYAQRHRDDPEFICTDCGGSITDEDDTKGQRRSSKKKKR
jgi:hypothetical protein